MKDLFLKTWDKVNPILGVAESQLYVKSLHDAGASIMSSKSSTIQRSLNQSCKAAE